MTERFDWSNFTPDVRKVFPGGDGRHERTFNSAEAGEGENAGRGEVSEVYE